MNSALTQHEINQLLGWEELDLGRLDASGLGHAEEVILSRLKCMHEEISALNQLLHRRIITANITAASLKSLFSS